MTDTEIKLYIIDNKICVVTNSRCMFGTTFLASIKSYINCVPIHNYWIIQGMNNNMPFYGYLAFLSMLQLLTNNKYFDYVIYIDDDCFIKDFSLLIDEFIKFKDSNSCLAGIQDGTAICHRNHSHIFVNPFLSFWNIKAIRGIDYIKILNEIIKNTSPTNEYFTYFKNHIKLEVYNKILEIADKSSDNLKKYRDIHFKEEPPYCKIVRNDVNNHIEPHQIPYSSDDNIAKTNFEPYYIIEQVLVMATELPIYYFFTTDLYEKNNDNIDNSGVTSVVMTSDDSHKYIAYHTWFSRMYTKWPKNLLLLWHTKRINSIIKSI